MKRVILIMLTLLMALMQTNCSMKVVFEKGKVSSDREIADDTFEKIRLAIKEKNSENVKVLFSTELQNSIESLGEDVKDFINYVEGDIISFPGYNDKDRI